MQVVAALHTGTTSGSGHGCRGAASFKKDYVNFLGEWKMAVMPPILTPGGRGPLSGGGGGRPSKFQFRFT